ncbi:MULTISPECIES: hypothetical protein [unclassified Nostoc]|nr:hypothetical protein [Nostoc sp. JL23]
MLNLSMNHAIASSLRVLRARSAFSTRRYALAEASRREGGSLKN